LYYLYNNHITTVRCIRCHKLPKALKEWHAYGQLRKTIDDFNEMVPLLDYMANRAMMRRHWKRIQETTGHAFDVDGENFTLRNILEAPLLQHKEDIEVKTDYFLTFPLQVLRRILRRIVYLW